MTVTDEDRKAAEDWLDETGGCGCDICLKQSAEFLSTIRQAAYAAGLERAAELWERHKYNGSFGEAIRAEKDKTNE